MHSPQGDELLRGVTAALEAQVLPALDDGAAQRQLKAALHILRRLERCWERTPPYLLEDAEDMVSTLSGLGLPDRELGRRLTLATERLAQLEAAGWRAAVSDLAALHDELQSCVIAADFEVNRPGGARVGAAAALQALYRRMVEREAWASGTARDEQRTPTGVSHAQ